MRVGSLAAHVTRLVSIVIVTGEEINFGTSIDYTELAKEAESNKSDVLAFLQHEKIRDKYKQLYETLLSNLMGKTLLDVVNVASYRYGWRWRTGGGTGQAQNVADEKVRSRKNYQQMVHRVRYTLMTHYPCSCVKFTASTRRIVFGRNTSIAAVPWQVSLREKSYPICGGSIITDIWLMTAAHCLIKSRANELSVRLGSSWKTHGGEMYDVKELYVHPRYASKTKCNDVGLVRLYSPLRFSARVLPIGVIAKATRLPADQPAIVSGWGRLREGGPSATYLQSSTIRTIAMKLCRRSGLDKKSIDPASMFCAGSFGQPSPDACQGDSGGPIIQNGVLIGVVSWGLGCARGNFPGVYTRLSYPVIWDWLHNHIINKSNNKT